MVRGGKATVAITVAIIGVIGVIIGVWLHQTGFFTSADIRFVRQRGTDHVCPSSLNTYSGDFEIFFSNKDGNRGTSLTVELNSPSNISFIKNKDAISIPAGSPSSLKFIINTSSLKRADKYMPYRIIDNVTINVMTEYVVNVRGNKKELFLQCPYVKKDGFLLLTK